MTALFTIAAVVGMMVLWVAVQTAWSRAFPGAFADEDVLAGRMACDSCSCGGGACRRDATASESGPSAWSD